MSDETEIDVPLICGGRVIGSASTPTLQRFLESYRHHTNKLFEIDGCRIFYGNRRDFQEQGAGIVRAMGNDVAMFVTIVDKLVEHDYRNTSFWWALTPDGQPFIKKKDDMFFTTTVLVPKRRKRDKQEWAKITMMDAQNPELAQYRKPDWAEAHIVMMGAEKRVIDEWKRKRREFVREAKESGKWETKHKERKAKRIAERTNRKMKTCDQVRTVIQELEQYLEDVQNGTATQKQVGDIYHEMSTLMSLNKRVKTLFPKE